jgi:hypothetical protein
MSILRKLLPDPKKWFAIDAVKAGSRTIADLANHKDVRNESFDEACQRLGITIEKLAEIESSLKIHKRFAQLIFIASFALFFLLNVFLPDNFWIGLNQSVMSLLVVFMAGIYVFRISFRLWQVQTRQLVGPWEFVEAGGLILIRK